jgi:RecQ-mediated genome instability protein 1
VLESLSLSPANAIDLPRILENIEAQYLNSDLRDSTVPSSGLPEQLLTGANAQTLSGNAVLVEIAAITEIGSSAFQLQNVRQMRIDRADLAGMNAERGEDGEQEEDEEGPVPRYPRSMLSLELCDGTHTFKAIEFKLIPTLLLGETPLGYKVKNLWLVVNEFG